MDNLHDKNTKLPAIVPVQIESSIDKMTLQLLTNKKTYNKYLSTQDPNYSRNMKKYENKVSKYENDIMSILTSYLEDINKQITTDLDEGADHFIKSCIKYLEMKELEDKTNGGCYETDMKDDDDVLFSEENESSEYIDKSSQPPLHSKHNSYWGKSIRKMDHMNMSMNMNMNVFMGLGRGNGKPK
jgi:hypothetical protein